MRRGVDVGQIDHELHVVEAQRVAGQVRAVPVPLLMRCAVVGGHAAQADLAETDIAAHQRFDDGRIFGWRIRPSNAGVVISAS